MPTYTLYINPKEHVEIPLNFTASIPDISLSEAYTNINNDLSILDITEDEKKEIVDTFIETCNVSVNEYSKTNFNSIEPKPIISSNNDIKLDDCSVGHYTNDFLYLENFVYNLGNHLIDVNIDEDFLTNLELIFDTEEVEDLPDLIPIFIEKEEIDDEIPPTDDDEYNPVFLIKTD